MKLEALPLLYDAVNITSYEELTRLVGCLSSARWLPANLAPANRPVPGTLIHSLTLRLPPETSRDLPHLSNLNHLLSLTPSLRRLSSAAPLGPVTLESGTPPTTDILAHIPAQSLPLTLVSLLGYPVHLSTIAPLHAILAHVGANLVELGLTPWSLEWWRTPIDDESEVWDAVTDELEVFENMLETIPSPDLSQLGTLVLKRGTTVGPAPGERSNLGSAWIASVIAWILRNPHSLRALDHLKIDDQSNAYRNYSHEALDHTILPPLLERVQSSLTELCWDGPPPPTPAITKLTKLHTLAVPLVNLDAYSAVEQQTTTLALSYSQPTLEDGSYEDGSSSVSEAITAFVEEDRWANVTTLVWQGGHPEDPFGRL